LKLPVLACAALLAVSAAAAGEMEAPRFILTQVNWAEAAAALTDHGIDPPAVELARLNAQTGRRFAGIGKSSVPVLLPIDIDRFRADAAAGKTDALTADNYFAPFHPSKFFLAGPAGYMATFLLDDGDGDLNFHFHKPVEIEITGAAFVYDLDGPDHQEVFPVNGLDAAFPGIQRIFRDAQMRYVFERFGVPYVVSIQCYDRPSARRYLSCREADPIARRFLSLLQLAGGSPLPIKAPHVDLTRPQATSPDFTYYGPGDLIPETGWHKLPGRADYHVYADMRFPIAQAPAYVKSQSFMPWGDCYRTGRSGTVGPKGAQYSCRVNGIPLVFDESAAVNFSYPWRDNFCELRDFLVGQCPGGWGHQGEDIRPSTCVLKDPNADRCMPYQHTVAAARDGVIWRNAGDLGAYIVVNTENDLVRFRYLHMNPKFMDEDGLLSGRVVSQGEIIGKVATWGDFPNGTSYHVHFNIQVFSKIGWAWVNPYMSLVLSYEKLIGARGTELTPDDLVPPPSDTAPQIAHAAPTRDVTMPLPEMTASQKAEPSVERHKPRKHRYRRHVRRHHHHRRHRYIDD